MIRKKRKGCGFSDFLFEAELDKSGAMLRVVRFTAGLLCVIKQCWRCWNVFFSVAFLETEQENVFDSILKELKNKSKNLLTSPSKPSTDSAIGDPHIANYIDEHFWFRSGVSKSNFGKTTQFLIIYINHIYFALQQVHEVVKWNDFCFFIFMMVEFMLGIRPCFQSRWQILMSPILVAYNLVA